MTPSPAGSIAASPSVLRKAFDVLNAFSHDQRVLTLSQIARLSGLPKSTTFRILSMLVEAEAVERTDSGYSIGLTMFSVGSLSAEARLRDLAMPHLQRLRRMTRQTVHLAILSDTDVVYLEKLPSLASPGTPAIVGARLPAHRTGVGKALLAFSAETPRADAEGSGAARRQRTRSYDLELCLDEVRRTGVAWDHQEAAKGLSCVAVPVFAEDSVSLAVSVSFSTNGTNGASYVNPLRETAAAIARATTFGPVPAVS